MKRFVFLFILVISNNLFSMRYPIRRAHTLPKTVYGNWISSRNMRPIMPRFDELCFCKTCKRMYMWYKCKNKECKRDIDVCNCKLKSFSAKHACPKCKIKTINVDCPGCKKRVLMCNCSDTRINLYAQKIMDYMGYGPSIITVLCWGYAMQSTKERLFFREMIKAYDKHEKIACPSKLYESIQVFYFIDADIYPRVFYKSSDLEDEKRNEGVAFLTNGNDEDLVKPYIPVKKPKKKSFFTELISFCFN